MVTTYLPKLPKSDWFQTSVTYRGAGTATFVDPDIEVQGKIVASFKEGNRARIVMNVRKISPDIQYGLMRLTHHMKLGQEGSSSTFFLKRENSECTKLEVHTTTPSPGVFRLKGLIGYHFPNNYNVILFEVYGINAYSNFLSETTRTPKYWAIPLLNLVTDFESEFSDIHEHPLRVGRLMPINSNLSPDHFEDGVRRHGVIGFNYLGKPGFIEALPDYEQRVKRLRAERSKPLVTALMASETIDQIFTDFHHRANPVNLTSILELATGSEVYPLWLELRDDAGFVVERTHFSVNSLSLLSTITPIHEIFHRTTGYLISLSLNNRSLSENDLRSLRNAISQFAKCELRIADLTKSLGYLCRALEILYGLHEKKLKPETLKNSLIGPYRAEAERYLGKLPRQIDGIIKQVEADKPNNSAQQIEILNQLKGKAGNIWDRSFSEFGEKLEALLEEFRLNDTEVMKDFVFPTGLGWLKQISVYRNDYAHRGYFSFTTNEEIRNIGLVTFHLHDIFVRIALKMLGYTEGYRSSIDGQHRSVDWVTVATTVQELGYQ